MTLSDINKAKKFTTLIQIWSVSKWRRLRCKYQLRCCLSFNSLHDNLSSILNHCQGPIQYMMLKVVIYYGEKCTHHNSPCADVSFPLPLPLHRLPRFFLDFGKIPTLIIHMWMTTAKRVTRFLRLWTSNEGFHQY